MATASMSIMALRHCSPTPTFPSCLSTIPATSLSSWKPFPLVRPLLEIKSPRYLCCSAQLKDTDNEIRSQQDQNQEEEEELDKRNNAPINEEVNKKKQRLQTGGVGRGSAESTDWIASSLTRRFGLAGGLAWFGFLAFGVISEQVKTRLELSQEQQNIRDIDGAQEVTLPNGIHYVDLRVGGGPSPRLGDLVVIGLQGKVCNPEYVFVDTFSRSKNSLAFLFGAKPYAKGICDGLEYVIQTMKVGGKRRATIPPELGFREMGVDLGGNILIPPQATLEYVVELQKVSIPPS
uniref:peptidylprolyl isomerase n=1 Tax=Picea sitchensis TaxID=3332 RepID=A9P1Y6_PICSI|nr:unknown [Picea sitchensis]